MIRKPPAEFGRIRKPPAGWGQVDEGAAIRTVRTASAVAKGSATVARRGGNAIVGLICYFFAAIWGFAALMSGLAMGSLPSLIGIGAMAALMSSPAAGRLRRPRRTPSDPRTARAMNVSGRVWRFAMLPD